MSDDKVYQDAEIVWVKLRSCWWPGEVCSHQRQPEGLLKHTKRKPYCVVKFFQEDSFEYVKNAKMIYPFNCSKKDEFIRKGHALLAKNKYMEQFPAAVSTAERLTRSVTRSSLFFNSRPDSIIKAILTDSPPQSESIRSGRHCEIVDKILQIKPNATTDSSQSLELSPTYKCSICDFQSTRQNVMVLHRRSHSGSGTTSHRNSFVSRSVISPTNSRGLQNSPEFIKDDKTPKPSVNKVIDETPVIKELELPHEIKRSVTEIESDLINTANNTNLAKERSFKDNNVSVSTVYIRPPPKKQLNFINCKSENIQKSLLADWIDEEKEDEDENEEENAKHIEAIEILNNTNISNQSSISFASTSASAEKLRNQESVDQQTSVELIEPQKPTSKIRNIPKKDRRNIVFTDFNETEDISHVHSQSQKPINDVCSQIHFNEEKDSSVEIPTLAPVNAELLIEEPLQSNKNTEEIPTSNMLSRGQRDKAKLTGAESYLLNASNNGKLPERKLSRHQEEISIELSPVDMTPFQLIDLKALDTCATVTGVDATLTVTSKAEPTEKYIMKYTNTLEANADNTTSKKTATFKMSTDESAIKDHAPDKILVELSTPKQEAEEPAIVETSVLDLATYESTKVNSTTLETKTVDLIRLEDSLLEQSKDIHYRIVHTNVKESTIEPISVEITMVETSTQEPITEVSTTEESTTVEYILVEQNTLKTTLVEPSSVETNREKTTSMEPIIIKPIVEEPNAEDKISMKAYKEKQPSREPNSLPLCSVESIPLEAAAVEPAAVEPSIEPTAVETSTVKPSTVKSSTEEQSAEEPSAVKPSTKEASSTEPSTIEASTVEPFTVEPFTVESSTVEISADEPSTEELSEVKPSTVESNTVEPATIESSAVEPTTENLNVIEPIIGEITAVQQNLIKPNIVELTPTDEIYAEIDSNKVTPISLEISGVKLDITETKITVLQTAEPNEKESNAEKPIVTERTNNTRLESVTDDLLTYDTSFVQISSVESERSSNNSTTDGQSEVPSILQVKAVEPNQAESISDIALTKKASTQEYNLSDQPSSSKNQLRKKITNTKSVNTSLELHPLFSSEIECPTEDNKTKLSHNENPSDDKILKEKYFSLYPVYSGMKSSDELPKNNTFSNDVKKILEEKKTLRSSTPRGCKRDTFEAKETLSKKRMTKTSANKIKFMDNNSSYEEQTFDSSFETHKSESSTVDESLSIQMNEQKLFNKIPTQEEYVDILNSSKADVEETSIQKPEDLASSLPTLKSQSELLSNLKPREAVKTDKSTRVAKPCIDEVHTADKSDDPQPEIICAVQSTELKSHVPVYLEVEDANPITELNESKPKSSFSKASLSCFDFNEEEDILTSIANFKKTYVSPEKNYNFGLDSRPKTPDPQKLELEMKDKQLSADIESLLKTTTLPANLASSSTASVSNRPFSNEVRGLPIKERGKRIFKSRNRFRVESCPSVSTTSTIELKPVSSSLLSLNKTDITPIEISKRVAQTQDIKKQDSANENVISHAEENVDMIKTFEEKTMDDRVTNSEEEIIGRIVFSPAEVYASSNEEALTESVQTRESIVSSSDMEVNSESLLISSENVGECTNNIICDVVNVEEKNFENSKFSCTTREKDEPHHNLLDSYIETVSAENEKLSKEVRNQEGNSMIDRISEHFDQNSTEAFGNDVKPDHDQENKSYTFDSSFVDEQKDVHVDNKENIDSKPKLLGQEANPIEDSRNVYAEENNDSVYDKEMSVDGEIGKANDSNCESTFEYELVTTEVSTIVDHVSNEEQNLENAKESSTEVSEEVVSCCDDGTFLNEMIIADATESQSSVLETEIDNSNVTLKYVEIQSRVIENPTDESNSCSNNEINAKIYANEVNDLHVSNAEDERLPTEVEHAETYSDDSSSIISDAEAEFGSPTSMLDEERVLNRAISGGETPATSAEGKGQRTLKKSTRKIRYQIQKSIKENKLIIQSLQCDTQESTSNDIVNEPVYDAKKYESNVKELLIEPKLFCDRKNSLSNKPVEKGLSEKETDQQENNDLLGQHTERVPEKDIVESNYENSDSSEDEDEEEICSPPIEPLLDEDTEAETIENYSTTTSLSKSEGVPQVDCEVAITNDIVPEFQLDHSEKCKVKDKMSEEHSSEIETTAKDESGADLNGKQSDSYYTITQKSDTIIQLNKHKEKSSDEVVPKGWTETSVDVRKSELAGEELTAAEALLLIPNQTTSILDQMDLIKEPVEPVDSLIDVENPQALLTEEQIKEETLECSELIPTQGLELHAKADIPKEQVRRKRRPHMKVTPRKRIINPAKLDESHIESKVAKLTNTPKDSASKLIKSSENPEPLNKSFAEQYEDNFVIKYMKEQLIEEMDSVESAKIKTEDSDKSVNPENQTLEKVHITVDISNPLSSQIATILGTNRPLSTEVQHRSGVKKRKQSVEDDIPSFIIKRPCPKTIAEEEAADRETIAQIQNLCPQVEITRKPSKDDQSSSTPTAQQPTTKPQIINQQILRAGNNQPLITVTPKGTKPEEGIFDISNMPIVLSNEKIVNEKVHLVITPTTNPQIIKQFQTQHQTQLSNTGTGANNFAGNTTTNVTKPGIPVRRTSCVRTKRTPSRQQLPETQQISEIQNFEQENYQQPIVAQQQSHQQQEYVHSHQQQEHNQLQQQRQNQQGQVQPQNQFQQQLQQQQFHHHQNQIQQQLQEEQNILIQQHHQLLLQQQLQLQQHQQQQLQNQHQIVANEKASQSNISEKQIGIDNRGNKYVIIRNPSNTVVMANSPEPCKVPQQRVPVTAEACDQSTQRKQRQKKQSPLTVQTGTLSKSPLPVIPPLPVTSPQPHVLSITSAQTNQPQQYFKDQHITSPSIPVTPAATAKPKGRGRGRPPKNKTETISSTKQTTSNNVKVNANGRRSTGRICEPLRQRSTRSAVTTSSEVHQTVMSSATVYTGNQHQAQTVGFMINPQFTSMAGGSSQSIRANNESYQSQTLGLSPQSTPPSAPGISIETSEVSGGGYAVPSLPVPGYPQTYLLCELIGNKYKEVFSKPLYLSPDRTRFLEVPDELVTEAHTKLSDSRREPNPNALKLVSDGTPHILQSRLIEINSENMNHNEDNGQQNEVLMRKHQQLSVEEQASALLCLQEQLTQEHLVHKQISQEQLVQERLVQEQLVQEQFVEEQFVQEQFVQEQFVQEQFVQEQFVQEQFVQEQFVQEQFVQEQFVPEQFVQEQFNLQPQQFSLQLARFETGEVIEDAERGQMMVVTTGTHNMILDDKSFFEFTGEKKIDFYNAEKDTYVLTPQVISSLLHHYALGHITAVPALNTEIGDQQEVSIADVIQNADSSTNILEVALDESGLYSEDQFINTGQILQIETPEGMQLIGTAAENADLIFHHMTKANTNETNVLLNQAPKMSAVEIPSDKNKRRFETKPSTPATLEDCLNVIGVPIQSPNVPTSLELPASVTNPVIVAKTRTPTPGTITMNEIIATGLCHHPDITSLPSMSSNDQELSYEFFQSSNTEGHEDKDKVNEESVVTDMGEYAVVTSSANFDDPGR